MKQTLPSFNDAFLSDGTALIPSLLAIFSAPNALDAFNTLPSVHRDIAASLLRRVLSSLPSETTSLKELILGCLKGLEDRDVEINLDLPDLSDEIKLVQSQPVSSGQYGDVYLAKRGNSLVSVRVLKTFNPSDTRGYKVRRVPFSIVMVCVSDRYATGAGARSKTSGIPLTS